jgi:hypothetical protein
LLSAFPPGTPIDRLGIDDAVAAVAAMQTASPVLAKQVEL